MLKSEPIVLDRKDGTIVHVFNRWVKDDPGRTALLEKKGGKWTPVTWGEFGENVENIAFGLKSINIHKGERVAVFSENRVEWTFADMGILAAGAVTVPIYANNSAEQLKYIINHSEAKAVFINTREQAEKIKEVRAEMSSLENVIIFPGKAEGEEEVERELYDLSLGELYEAGNKEKSGRSESLDDLIRDVALEDISTILYTAGTTGMPKGCILGHDNIMFVCQSIAHILPVRKDDLVYSFLPLAHALERNGGQFISIFLRIPTAYAQNQDTVGVDMMELKPTFTRAVPRFFEKIYNTIQAAVAGYSPQRQNMFKWSLNVGRKHVRHIEYGRKVPFSLQMKKEMANRLIYSKVKKELGGRLRFIFCGGAPLSKELAEFFAALDILIMEGYGLTECTVVATVNREDNYRFGTVGIPIPGCEIKIARDGEIMIRHGGVFRGYYKDEEATREILDDDGWLRTGDVGYLDNNNALVITDRKKDIIITAGGKNITPQYTENLLKKHPLISQAVVYGDNKPYLVALLTIDKDSLVEQAERYSINLDDTVSVSENEDILREINGFVEDVNTKLSRAEQIRKIKVLEGDFLQDKEEVTPTQRVKRNVIHLNYRDVIEELYGEQ